MAEYTAVLKSIDDALNDRGNTKTASDLIAEVRDKISDGPNLRSTILGLEATIKNEFKDLRNALTGGFGAPASGGKPGAGGSPEQLEQLVNIATNTNEERKELTQIERFAETITEMMGHGGGVGGGGLGGAFGTSAIHSRIRSIETLIEKNTSTMGVLRGLFSDFFASGGHLQQQYEYQQKTALSSLINLSTRTLDVVNAFQHLENFIKRNIIERYSGYMANRAGGLSGSEYFFDDIKRIIDYMRGIRPEVGSGLVNTQESIKSSLQSGLTSPMLMYGKSIDELSFMYRQLRDDLSKRGINPQQFGSQAQLQQLFDAITEREKAAGPFQGMRSDKAEIAQFSSLKYLQDIARYTNVSADELTKVVKATTQQSAELQAMGILTAEEARHLQDFQAGLTATGPGGKYMGDLLNKFIASQSNPALFYRNNKELAETDVMMRGQLTEYLGKLSLLSREQGDYAEKQTRLTQLSAQYAPVLTKVFDPGMAGVMYHDKPQFGQIGAAVNALANNAKAMPKPPEYGTVDKMAQAWENVTNKFPMFADAMGSAVRWVADFGMHIAAFVTVARMLRGGGAAAATGGLEAVGGVAAGAGRYLTTVAGTLARVAGPVLGGLGGAGAAALGGASTAGVVGAGAGGATGAMIGGALGTLTDWFTGPFGTIVGASIGGYLGSWLGQSLGERVGGVSPGAAAAPAVPPPANMAGPEMAAVQAATSGQDMNRNNHAEQMQILSGMLNAGVDGNNILGQIFSELSRQTAALTGQAGTSSTPLPAHGLSSNAPSFTSGSRAEAAYPTGPVSP